MEINEPAGLPPTSRRLYAQRAAGFMPAVLWARGADRRGKPAGSLIDNRVIDTGWLR